MEQGPSGSGFGFAVPLGNPAADDLQRIERELTERGGIITSGSPTRRRSRSNSASNSASSSNGPASSNPATDETPQPGVGTAALNAAYDTLTAGAAAVVAAAGYFSGSDSEEGEAPDLPPPPPPAEDEEEGLLIPGSPTSEVPQDEAVDLNDLDNELLGHLLSLRPTEATSAGSSSTAVEQNPANDNTASPILVAVSEQIAILGDTRKPASERLNACVQLFRLVGASNEADAALHLAISTFFELLRSLPQNERTAFVQQTESLIAFYRGIATHSDKKYTAQERVEACIKLLSLVNPTATPLSDAQSIATLVATVLSNLLPQLSEALRFQDLQELAKLTQQIQLISKAASDARERLQNVVYVILLAYDIADIRDFASLLLSLDLPTNLDFFFNQQGSLASEPFKLLRRALEYYMGLPYSLEENELAHLFARICTINDPQQKHILLALLAKKYQPALDLLITEIDVEDTPLANLLETYLGLPFTLEERNTHAFAATLLNRILSMSMDEDENIRMGLLIKLAKKYDAARDAVVEHFEKRFAEGHPITDRDELNQALAHLEALRDGPTQNADTLRLHARLFLPATLFPGFGVDGTNLELDEQAANSASWLLTHSLFTEPSATQQNTIIEQMTRLFIDVANAPDMGIHTVLENTRHLIETIGQRETRIPLDTQPLANTLVDIALQTLSAFNPATPDHPNQPSTLERVFELLVLSTRLTPNSKGNPHEHALETLVAMTTSTAVAGRLLDLVEKLILERKVSVTGQAKTQEPNALARQKLREICTALIKRISDNLENAETNQTSPTIDDLTTSLRQLRHVVIMLETIQSRIPESSRSQSAASKYLGEARVLIEAIESKLLQILVVSIQSSANPQTLANQMTIVELLSQSTNRATFTSVAQLKVDFNPLVIQGTNPDTNAPTGHLSPENFSRVMALAIALTQSHPDINSNTMALTRQLIGLAHELTEPHQHYQLLRALALRSNEASGRVLRIILDGLPHIEHMNAEQAADFTGQIVRLWDVSLPEQRVPLVEALRFYSQRRLAAILGEQLTESQRTFIQRQVHQELMHRLVELAKRVVAAPDDSNSKGKGAASNSKTSAQATPQNQYNTDVLLVLFNFLIELTRENNGAANVEPLVREHVAFLTSIATLVLDAEQNTVLTYINRMILVLMDDPIHISDNNEFAALIRLIQLKLQIERESNTAATKSSWLFGSASSTPIAVSNEEAVAHILRTAPSRRTIELLPEAIASMLRTAASTANASAVAASSSTVATPVSPTATSEDPHAVAARRMIRSAALKLIEDVKNLKPSKFDTALLLLRAAQALDVLADLGSANAIVNITKELAAARATLTSKHAKTLERIDAIIAGAPAKMPAKATPSTSSTPVANRRPEDSTPANSPAAASSSGSGSSRLLNLRGARDGASMSEDESRLSDADFLLLPSSSQDTTALSGLFARITSNSMPTGLIGRVIRHLGDLEGEPGGLTSIASLTNQLIVQLSTVYSEADTTALQTYLKELIENTLKHYSRTENAAQNTDDADGSNRIQFVADDQDPTPLLHVMDNPDTETALANPEEIALVEAILKIRSQLQQLQDGFKKAGLWRMFGSSSKTPSTIYTAGGIEFVIGGTQSNALHNALIQLIVENAATPEAVTALVNAFKQCIELTPGHVKDDKKDSEAARKRMRDVLVKLQENITSTDIDNAKRVELLQKLANVLKVLGDLGSGKAKVQHDEVLRLIKEYSANPATPPTTPTRPTGSTSRTEQSDGSSTTASSSATPQTPPPSTSSSSRPMATPARSSVPMAAADAISTIEAHTRSLKLSSRQRATAFAKTDLPFTSLAREERTPEMSELDPLRLTFESNQAVSSLIRSYVEASTVSSETDATRHVFDQQGLTRSLFVFIQTLPGSQRIHLLKMMAPKSMEAYRLLMEEVRNNAANHSQLSPFNVDINLSILSSLSSAGHATRDVAMWAVRIVMPTAMPHDDILLNLGDILTQVRFGIAYRIVFAALLAETSNPEIIDNNPSLINLFYNLCYLATESATLGFPVVEQMLNELVEELTKKLIQTKGQKTPNIEKLQEKIRAFVRDQLNNNPYVNDNLPALLRILAISDRVAQPVTAATSGSASSGGNWWNWGRNTAPSSSTASANAPAKYSDAALQFVIQYSRDLNVIEALLSVIQTQEHQLMTPPITNNQIPEAAKLGRIRLHNACKALRDIVIDDSCPLPPQERLDILKNIKSALTIIGSPNALVTRGIIEKDIEKIKPMVRLAATSDGTHGEDEDDSDDDDGTN